ncbi:hypothetical protein AbraIFM66950_009617 [Aspergillus brasiliensis]|nr:hypothetical protein AbraIFM66950_009617 [Aspergillus brasiliensis]
MLFKTTILAGSLVAAFTCAGATSSSPFKIDPYPKTVARPRNPSVARTRECTVKAKGNGKDDSISIFNAVKSCNKGGKVILNGNYTVASPLDLTFLEAIDIEISGNITFPPNIDYWTEHSFKYTYQTSSAMWRFGGNDVNIYGGGLVDGQGNAWWLAEASNSTLLRPTLFILDGMTDATISDLNFIDPPNAGIPTLSRLL